MPSYTYTDDYLTKIQTPSTTYNFTYGNFGLRSSVIVGDPQNPEHVLAEYYYDSYNRLEKLDYGNQDSVQYTYDAQGRVTQETYEDGATVTYSYDNTGALATVTDSATGITTTYYYDLIDRLVKYEEKGTNFSHSVTYIYNAENNLQTLTEVINGVKTVYSYAYDNDNRVTSVTVGNGTTVISSVSYTYDTFGRITDQVTKHGDSTVLNKAATFTDPSATSTSGQVASYNGFTYTYDDNGNILSVQDGAFSHYYEYDSAGQVVRETDMFLAFSTTWTYDEAGNIIYKTGYDHPLGSLENIAYDSQSIYTYGDSNWGDLLTAYDGATITYDEIGNPLNDGTWTYTWEHGRQLASMEKADGTKWEYTYNASGMRTKRESEDTTYTYVYNGSQLVQMTVGSNTLTFTYDAAGVPLTVTLNGTVYYYRTNLQGDVIYILNSSGNPVVHYTYNAWGSPMNSEGSLYSTLGVLNPLRYRGYVYDKETGLYYLQSRYYDPEIGRFVNADALVTTGQGFIGNNTFAYCLNCPVNLYDPQGTCSRFLGFLWKIDCCKATCPESSCYNPSASKIAVLYDGRMNTYFKVFGNKGFRNQGTQLTKILEKKYDVESIPFTTIPEFINAWNSLSGDYDAVYIIGHGYPGGISCAGQSIGGPHTVEYSMWDLDPIDIPFVHLYTCNGATVDGQGHSAAQYLSQLTGGTVLAVANGNIGYIYGTPTARPTHGGVWSFTRGGVTTFSHAWG